MTVIVLKSALVLDVVSGELTPDQSVVIEGRRIVAVDRNTPIPSSARVIDLAGKVLMPGLCDAHVHVTAATADFAALEGWPQSYVAAHSSHILRSMLLRGFTTVRDAGGADHGLAQAVEERLIVGPRVLFCGKAISQTGGHADMRLSGEGNADPCACSAGLGRICDGVTEVRRACREFIRQGAHHIKLMVSGGVISPTDRISSTQLADDELAAAAEEANAAEIYCMAHAYTPRAIRRAVLAGVRSIEHGNLLDETTAELMREHGTFLVPTLVTYYALARQGDCTAFTATMRDKLREVQEAGLRALELAVRTDVPVVFGTDLLGPMHSRQLDEFRIRAEIQSPLELVRSATLHAARLFDMENDIGVIRPGAFADLIAVSGNPLRDPSVLQCPEKHLHLVVKEGEVVVSRL